MIVRVVSATDPEIYDVRPYIGRLGVVVGRGPSPSDGEDFYMVRFSDRTTVPFWREEIAARLVTIGRACE